MDSRASRWTRFRDRLQNPDLRARLIGLVFVFGTVLGLPDPLTFTVQSDKILMLLLWFSLLALAACVWSAMQYVKLAWLVCFVASLLAWWKLDLFLPCVMMVLWAFWGSIRYAALAKRR